jgi:hypothetical protein
VIAGNDHRDGNSTPKRVMPEQSPGHPMVPAGPFGP